MTLAEAKDGQRLRITAVRGDDVTVQALRFGIETGTNIRVQKNISGGPVIITKNQIELAIGRDIAQAIDVEPDKGT